MPGLAHNKMNSFFLARSSQIQINTELQSMGEKKILLEVGLRDHDGKKEV